QAEDGIRDDLVTGVQTCALPISCLRGESSPSFLRGRPNRLPHASPRIQPPRRRFAGVEGVVAVLLAVAGVERLLVGGNGRERERSEERRVGKGGGAGCARWSWSR